MVLLLFLIFAQLPLRAASFLSVITSRPSMDLFSSASIPSVTDVVQNPTGTRRTFRFVPFDRSIESVIGSTTDEVSTISCDGKVDGTTLDLTHWNGNVTPDQYYADTSTGMALLFGKENDEAILHKFDNAVVVNNHYDTDGALSIFSCLYPSVAQKYEDILISGAEAGDFNEWNTDDGVKLECSIAEILSRNDNNEERAYKQAMDTLPELLAELQEGTDNGKHKSLWESRFEQITKDYGCFLDTRGTARIEPGPGNIVIVHMPSYLSPLAVHRAMKDYGCYNGVNPDGPTRILRSIRTKDATMSSSSSNAAGQYTYYYEQPGYGWVHKLKQRKSTPPADAPEIVDSLGTGWKTGGRENFISICQGINISQEPQRVVELLSKIDRGATWIF